MNFKSDNPTPLLQSMQDSLTQKGIDLDKLPGYFRMALDRLSRFSPRLSSICILKPEVLEELYLEADLSSSRTPGDLSERLNRHISSTPDREFAVRALHRVEMVRIAMRDLAELGDIQIITQELSHLADTVVQAIFSFVWDRMIVNYGEPLSSNNEDPSRMCVIGMGKLGGEELNFSSDIDLMFVYDKDGITRGGELGQLDNKKFFQQLTQEISDILGKPTPEGFLYRVDLRLRPEGERGALAVPLMAVEIYYHNYGQNWERQSLLKARLIAGDVEVGKRFIDLISPFTYRKYVDEIEVAEVLRSIDAMRNRSLEQIRNQETRWINFKNGYGGIRDIEFFVQAVQMLYGGQYPEIKLKGTLLSLLRMHESHLLHSKEYGLIAYAYRFLRRVEHSLQMVDLQQVYELPTEPSAQQRLSESLGYPSYEHFLKEYQQLTKHVREIYEGVFRRDEWNDSLEAILNKEIYDESIEHLLKPYEFEDPRRAFNFIRALLKSPDAHLQLKTTRLFKVILPRLLRSLKESPDPDMALANFEKLVESFKAKTALYQTLSEEPQLLDLLVSVTSSSDFLTRLILRDPSLMESIGRSGFLDELITQESLASHLQIMTKAFPRENLRGILLRVQNASMFRSGIRFLVGLADVEHMGIELANIADFVIDVSMKPVSEQMAEKYPEFTGKHAGDIAILGYGKLGGREFNVASDCDLVFVYTDHRMLNEIDSTEYFHRWGTKYTDYMQSKSPLGFLYQVDTRLRPHGKGQLASSQSSFYEYYQKHAQFWEKMALSRARFICGNPGVKTFLKQLKDEILFSYPASNEEMEDLLKMREKIEKEKRAESLKAGPGGLIDVEFIAQALVLRYGSIHSSIRSTSTLTNIRNAAQENILSRSDARQLINSYLLMREVENRLRIVNNVSLDALPHDPIEMEKLTRRYALRLGTEKPSPESFRKTIDEHAKRVRKIFDSFFDQMLHQT